MNIHLFNNPNKISGNINITGSKSVSNRLLILQALYPNIKLKNISNSDDTNTLKKALSSSNSLININHAGTAMRFLTAYFAIELKKETVLTGSKRMKERPIKILVDALLMLGAEISYEGDMGFPPIKIKNTIEKEGYDEIWEGAGPDEPPPRNPFGDDHEDGRLQDAPLDTAFLAHWANVIF